MFFFDTIIKERCKMSNILIKSEVEQNDFTYLLNKKIPSYRQAYSDRTSWIMACMSELAYLKFNKPFFDVTDEKLIKQITALIDEKRASSLKKIYDLYSYDSEKEKKKLIEELQLFSLKLETTFDNNGSQAIIASNDTFYILAFRGTEVSSMEDIKADLDAKTVLCESGGKIHKGFNEAFGQLHIDIQNYLNNNLNEDKPLFITGHSLGGALATIATKKLNFKYGIAACYTFGSPRVADEMWVKNIKTPIYRLVNSADPVTMLPPGADTINILSWILKLIPYLGGWFNSKLLANFSGYYHAGYMRYLTNIENGDYQKSELLYSASFLRRMRAYVTNKASFKNIPADHSITVYRKKLKFIALSRNRE
jgi:triacylglycerol lipase